jgi:hypothetical protein
MHYKIILKVVKFHLCFVYEASFSNTSVSAANIAHTEDETSKVNIIHVLFSKHVVIPKP